MSEDAVSEFVEGRMASEEASNVDRHMAECAACRSLVADVAKIAFDDEAPAQENYPGIGDVVGRYRIGEVVGVGGMGVVYAAEDPELGRRIALKLIRADLASTSGIELTKRLHQEARAMAKISHPNVVTVHDIGTIGNHLFVAMEYVHGKTLRAWRSAEPRSWRQIVDAFNAAGRGLIAAHAVGLVHRDFKPENVLCGDDGRVRVTDFGLARGNVQAGDDLEAPGSVPRAPITDESTLTTGRLVGTPAYMAPEQLRGAPADTRSDQFSFAVALFESLYGKRPYPAKNLRELADNVARGKVVAPPAGSDVPSALNAIVTRALEPAPDDRFPSMQALLDALAAIEPASPAPRSRAKYVALSLVAVATLAGLAVLTQRSHPPLPSPAGVQTFPRSAEGGECARGPGLYCNGHGVNGEPSHLYRCADGRITEEKACSVACLHLGRGAADACNGDTTSCPFNGTGVYCGFNYLSGNPKNLYRCTEGKVVVEQVCPSRCVEEPDHVADHCE